MSFKLLPVNVVDDISCEDFTTNYLKPGKLLVIKNLAKSWPAYTRWTPDYLKKIVYKQVVPLYDNSKADPSKPINYAATKYAI